MKSTTTKKDPSYISCASTRVGTEALQLSRYRVLEQTLVENHTYLTCVVYSLCEICAQLSIKAHILPPTFFRSCDAITLFEWNRHIRCMHRKKSYGWIFLLFFSAWMHDEVNQRPLFGKCWVVEFTSTRSHSAPTPTTSISLLFCFFHSVLFFFPW